MNCEQNKRLPIEITFDSFNYNLGWSCDFKREGNFFSAPLHASSLNKTFLCQSLKVQEMTQAKMKTHAYADHLCSCALPVIFLSRRPASIDHFTVVYLVAWSLNEGEADGDLVLMENLLAFLMLRLLFSC